MSGIAHRDGAAVARGHRLGRVEAEDRRVAELGDAHAVALGLDGVRGVFDQREMVTIADVAEARHVGELAVEVHRDDRARARRDRRFDRARIDEPGARVDVGEHRHGAVKERRVRRGDEGHRRGDDLVARRDTERVQREGEPHRAARDADDLPLPEERAERAASNSATRGPSVEKQRCERLGDGRDLGVTEVVLVKLDALHRRNVASGEDPAVHRDVVERPLDVGEKLVLPQRVPAAIVGIDRARCAAPRAPR